MRILIARAVVVCVLVVAAPGVAPVALAGLLNPTEASLIVQSTAMDTDAMFLSLLYGFELDQTLNYSASMTTTSWSGTLMGTYLGTGLSLGYSGDLSNYQSSGVVTWTDSGSYGTQLWSGSGSAMISDTSSTTFQVGLSYSMTVGSGSASIEYLIPGTVDSDGTIMYGDPSNSEVGSGTLAVNGAPRKDPGRFSYNRYNTKTRSTSDFIMNGAAWINNITTPNKPPPIRIDGMLKSTPEPPSCVLMGFGLLGFVGILARRKRLVWERPRTDHRPRHGVPAPTHHH